MAVQVESHDSGSGAVGTLLAVGFWGTIVWAVAGNNFAPLVLTALFFLVHLWHKDRAKARGMAKTAGEAFERFVGGPVDYYDWAKEGGNTHCIALSVAKKEFYIYQNGLMARIPVQDIRSYDVDYMELIGGSIADKRAKSGEQIRLSGVFVKTKSLDHPEIKFRTANKRLVEKWLEIWTQLQEGSLPTTEGVSVGKAG
ncbi:MAG: hypothetical protein H7Z12_15010 [Rhodospirillaceae bacterium]|nr:hypothetical protein [Rhodospirillales bacterium]